MLPLRKRSEQAAINPYLMAGAGILFLNSDGNGNDTNVVLTPGAGASVLLGKFNVFGEYQGVDFFDESRVLIGFRVGR